MAIVTVPLERQPIETRFHHLAQCIAGPAFLRREGLGSELPFFICPYRPDEAEAMQDMVRTLVKHLHDKGVSVLEINLYDLAVELLQREGDWEELLRIEPEVPKENMLEQLQSLLDPRRYLIPAITEKMEARCYDVLFLTGVGEVFPFIRSHTVLNNLEGSAFSKPLVMFFPGAYTYERERGSSLQLFGIFQNERYYRAFNIYSYSAAREGAR